MAPNCIRLCAGTSDTQVHLYFRPVPGQVVLGVVVFCVVLLLLQRHALKRKPDEGSAD